VNPNGTSTTIRITAITNPDGSKSVSVTTTEVAPDTTDTNPDGSDIVSEITKVTPRVIITNPNGSKIGLETTTRVTLGTTVTNPDGSEIVSEITEVTPGVKQTVQYNTNDKYESLSLLFDCYTIDIPVHTELTRNKRTRTAKSYGRADLGLIAASTSVDGTAGE
jgi:hypothetical protein